MQTVRSRYRAAIEAGTHQHDAAQARVVEMLDALQGSLESRPWSRRIASLLQRRTSRSGAMRRDLAKGLYLWGSVGRGKTWLMDQFFDCVDTDKRRVHFHSFMRDVHLDLKRIGASRDPLKKVADGIAGEARLLCFDEFHVSDIGDAMILGGLLQALFERGVTVVATSNSAPQDLYRDGLQRSRFLPAIAAIERHMDVVEVGGDTDFRLRALEQASLYHSPAGGAADARLEADFLRIAGEPGEPDWAIEIEGRLIPTVRCADGVVWFGFDALCDGPRSAADYIEVARLFHTVLVSDVPRLDETLENPARRFIALVDEFYDRNVKLILTAEVPVRDLYTGDRLGFEFQRTMSRLLEMQSHEYLAQPHLP